MNNIIKSLLFILLTAQLFFAQENPSIHQTHYFHYKNNDVLKKIKPELKEDIIPLNKTVTKQLTKTVFGYYPYWEYSRNAHKNFDYNLLTHIATFDFAVSAIGTISNPPGWPWTSFINEAHSNGVKVIMTLLNNGFNPDTAHSVMTNVFYRYDFMNNVQKLVRDYKLDGVNLDFENLHLADRGELVNGFLKELTDSVHAINEDLEVSFASPAINWGGWDFYELANSCDYLFVMEYAYYGKWSKNTGPTAPLVSYTSINVTSSINSDYGTLSFFYPEKLILGVPYYGPHWITSGSNAESSVEGWVANEFFRNTQPEAETYGYKWSTKFKNSWYYYLSGNDHHQVWIDNDSSLGLKYDLAIAKNLKGVGMWALGYDGGRNELWDLLEDKFTVVVNVDEDEGVPETFTLEQNYPNPFNPNTVITYAIPEHPEGKMNSVELKIYNHLGSEIKTLVNIFQPSGIYNVNFNSGSLASGVYFYRVKVNEQCLTKKMILLK